MKALCIAVSTLLVLLLSSATTCQSTILGHHVAPSLDSVKKDSVRPSSPANLSQYVRHLLGSLERTPVPPSERNHHTYIPRPPAPKRGDHTVDPSFDTMKDASVRPPSPANSGHHVRHLLGSLERTPVPPSERNRPSYIPGPPKPKRDGHTVAASFNTRKDASVTPPSPANPGHHVRRLLGSLERTPLPPSERNPPTYIPGRPMAKPNGHTVAPSFNTMKDASVTPPSPANPAHHVRRLLASLERTPLPPSERNPPTYIPGRPMAKPNGHTVAPSFNTMKDASVRPPSPANPAHHVRHLLGSPERTPVPPSEQNRRSYIPGPPKRKRSGHNAAPSFDTMKDASVSPPSSAIRGHRVRHLLGLLDRAPVPPSKRNPPTYIPGRPVAKPHGHSVTP